MEDGAWLNADDKKKMEDLKRELAELKAEHKSFAKKGKALTPEERERWRLNGQRTNAIYVEIKELRFKNILGASESGT